MATFNPYNGTVNAKGWAQLMKLCDDGKKHPTKPAPNWMAHHGIEGQRWGVRHGPPYPLDDGVSTGKKLKVGHDAKKTAKPKTHKKGQKEFEKHLKRLNCSKEDFARDVFESLYKEDKINSNSKLKKFLQEKNTGYATYEEGTGLILNFYGPTKQYGKNGELFDDLHILSDIDGNPVSAAIVTYSRETNRFKYKPVFDRGGKYGLRKTK